MGGGAPDHRSQITSCSHQSQRGWQTAGTRAAPSPATWCRPRRRAACARRAWRRPACRGCRCCRAPAGRRRAPWPRRARAKAARRRTRARREHGRRRARGRRRSWRRRAWRAMGKLVWQGGVGREERWSRNVDVDKVLLRATLPRPIDSEIRGHLNRFGRSRKLRQARALWL
ncbi:MAG: hypothetical protein J3K34DRAFT_402861 [Monoraphidium minutum]|nr:MAG: hypothetical protein J3K34DRAFT_402861 [Monoraphidium minutum]